MKKKGKHGTRQAAKATQTQTASPLAEVLQLYQAGQFIAAEQCVRRFLDEPESRVAAWKILGAILQQQGRFVEAMAAKEHAVGLAPEDPFVHYNLATALQSLGRLQEAVQSYQAAIRLKPDYAEAHSNMGVALRDLGHPDAAEACYREAIRIKPDFDKAHSNLGLVLQDAGRLIEAVACYQTAVKLNGGLPEPLNNLGVALKELGRVDEAVQCYQAAIRLKPDYAAAHNNAGVGLKALGRLQEAAVMYQRAIALDPDYAEAYSNYGVLLKDAGQLAESEVAYRHALRLRPAYAQAFNNLGITLKELGKIREAEACYREALRINPQYPEAYSNLGVLLKELGAYSQAIECYQQALRIKPDYIDARSNLLFALNFVTSLPPETVVAVAKEFGALVSTQAQPKCPAGSLNANPEILRIGFVSGDLRHHPVGFFVEAFLQYLPAQGCEVLTFPTNPKTDDVTTRLHPLFKDWIPLYGKSDHTAAQLIHEQGVHVLVDLSGHTAHNRLGVFAFRPAPVQVSWLGYFATTGLPEMDYFLGDPYMAPADEAAHFTERLWQLKETWLCLTPPRGAPERKTAPVLHNGYVTFGCFGNLAKMGDAVINLWASILRDCPSARLFLKSKQLADAAVVRNIKSRFAALGVAEGRLILEGLSSRAAYLDAYQRIDMVLDTFPYPGGTTSAEAIWMGVPVLTLKGDRFLAHLGESIAHNAENADWIAQDADDYRRKAVAFAADVARLTDPRHADRQRLMQTPLFDAPRFAANFAAAMWGMYSKTVDRVGCQVGAGAP